MQDPYRKLVQRVREEFVETPGLRLTVQEASRFWALDEATCAAVLRELAQRGFLAQGGDRRFQMYVAA
ncbi:MAG: hypothetical protein DMF89_27210 [Acidobacteria bacterium]|nr:MAG: hypothetical protein DMF89_27210 [Acidobacteriota bacterium]